MPHSMGNVAKQFKYNTGPVSILLTLRDPLFISYAVLNACFTGGLDLIIVPGLGFTRHGDRLGRGKGFYDTYLHNYRQKLKVKPVTVALSFYEQICGSIPTTDLDVQIDLVLFEDQDCT